MTMICATGSKPYNDLYVYLLNGMLSNNDEQILGDAFLGNWVEGGNSFLFFSRPSRDVVAGVSSKHPGIELVEDHYFTYEQWQGGGLDAIRIGKFLIVPPWVDREAGEGVIKIFLDPGVVFGNCLHPTTRDCLKALSIVAAKDQMDRVLDLGTGTGILAIAAALVGAKRVLAVDLNPLCVKTARENVKLNHPEGTIRVVEGSAEDIVGEPADLVFANIHYKVIKGLLGRKSFSKKRQLIISGLMRSQYRDVRVELERRNFRIVREWDHEMTWYTVLAKKEGERGAPAILG
jgi:ribosomal protein L11 methyltransferase